VRPTLAETPIQQPNTVPAAIAIARGPAGEGGRQDYAPVAGGGRDADD
jgi:hypothetical protein